MRTMRIRKPYLDQIRDGRKTLEVRVGYPGILKIGAGEAVEMIAGDERVVVRVKEVRRYGSFEEMLAAEPAGRIAPEIASREELLRAIREIYPPDRERLGVVVLDVRPEREAP
jgi:ASC-1-like (ASCH) protein